MREIRKYFFMILVGPTEWAFWMSKGVKCYVCELADVEECHLGGNQGPPSFQVTK